MSFSSSTVTIGQSTKRSDYDRLLANTQYLKAEDVYEKKTFLSSVTFGYSGTAIGTVTISTSTASGGADGDIWFQREA